MDELPVFCYFPAEGELPRYVERKWLSVSCLLNFTLEITVKF
jgi:hypothetical protein